MKIKKTEKLVKSATQVLKKPKKTSKENKFLSCSP